MNKNKHTEENLDENLKENQETAQNESNEKEHKTDKEVKDALEEKINQLSAEIEEMKQSYLRKQAEFQNYTKRKENEYNELKKFAAEKVLTKFLGNLDNLERALSTTEQSKDFNALHDGIVMITKALKDLIKSEGVEEIQAEGIFDPVYHHAVMTEEIEEGQEHKDNEISKVLEKGYTLNGKIIRPAMVSVYKKN